MKIPNLRRARLLILLAVVAIVHLILFPGRQTSIAFTLATGIGVSSLQQQVDLIEQKAISKVRLDEAEIEFLKALYRSMVTGARLTFILRQSAEMMDRYLSSTGEDLKTDPRIFRNNRKVQLVMDQLKAAMLADVKDNRLSSEYTSGTFYMPDPSSPDSVFGLYHGRIVMLPTMSPDGSVAARWRAEVPWSWPSYEKLEKEYGHPQAESFPLPNYPLPLF